MMMRRALSAAGRSYARRCSNARAARGAMVRARVSRAPGTRALLVAARPPALQEAAAAQSSRAPSSASPAEPAEADASLLMPNERKRNIAIIAHVDHGKSTLADALLRQSKTAVRAAEGERVMDSNVLEKERGITITSKSTGIVFESGAEEYLLNIVDTPGHADFGGEVERVLSMVDCVALVVCATEGVKTQTRFVLRKALEAGLRPFVVINKADRDSSRIGEVENEVFDLFVNLDASDEQLEFPILYASARDGWAVRDMDSDERSGMGAVFETIVEHVPPPVVEEGQPFRMSVTQLESNKYLGKLMLGRIRSGTVSVGDQVTSLDDQGNVAERARVTKVLSRIGLEQMAVPVGAAGDIVAVAGFGNSTVNYTLCDPAREEVIETTPIDPPTLSMLLQTNSSPLAGRDGTYVTSTQLLDRLQKEVETNVSLRLSARGEVYELKARGELQLGVLLETMRREGYEVSVSPPRVVYRTVDSGEDFVWDSHTTIPKSTRSNLLEPVEQVEVEVPEGMAGSVMEMMASRKGQLQNYEPAGEGMSALSFHVPTRGLVGFRSVFVDQTRGLGVLNTIFHGYEPHMGEITRQQKGAIISTAAGKSTVYALSTAESRGTLFIGPNEEVYAGMVIGESSREDDVEVNPVKAKAVNNIRTMLKDDKTFLTPPKQIDLEAMIALCRNDEVIEVTPKSLRLRKAELDPAMRRKARRDSKKM